MQIRPLLALALLLVASVAHAADQRVIVAFREAAAPAGARGPALERHWRAQVARAHARVATWLRLRDARALAAAAPRELWIAGAVALTVPAELVPELARRDDVTNVELDGPVQLPAPVRGAARANGDSDAWTYGLLKMKVPEVRRLFGLTGRGVRVGVIDSGADGAHPDLAGKIERFHDLVGGRAAAYDDNGHGTHCAGTIAGGAASGRAIGVAPQARLLVCKAFDAHGATNKERLLAAMQWMADPDGDPATNDRPAVCSNSWFGGGSRKFLLAATQRWVALRILPVFAQGNTGPGASTTWIPAGYLESFAAGATDQNDVIATFSSHGPIIWDGLPNVKPDVVAPGEEITSAQPGGGYQMLSGTSMATPHVAGAVALLLEARPQLTLDQLRTALERTAVGLGEPGKDNVYGSGRVDLLAALQALAR